MPNYFKVKNAGIVELTGVTIQGEGKKGTGNAAEQHVAKTLYIPVEDITEITKEEFDKLDNDDKEMDCLACNLNKENACADCCRDWDNEDED